MWKPNICSSVLFDLFKLVFVPRCFLFSADRVSRSAQNDQLSELGDEARGCCLSAVSFLTLSLRRRWGRGRGALPGFKKYRKKTKWRARVETLCWAQFYNRTLWIYDMYLIWRNICIVPATVSVLFFTALCKCATAWGGKINLKVTFS